LIVLQKTDGHYTIFIIKMTFAVEISIDVQMTFCDLMVLT
jgi:hypothetical protein